MRRLPWISPLAIVALAVLGVAPRAHADEIDPAEEVCGKAGDACELDGNKGTCVKATCSKLDYGNMKEDEGGPSRREYECAKCVPGTTPESSEAKTDGETKAKGSSCSVGSSTSMTSFAVGLLLLGVVARRRR